MKNVIYSVTVSCLVFALGCDFDEPLDEDSAAALSTSDNDNQCKSDDDCQKGYECKIPDGCLGGPIGCVGECVAQGPACEYPECKPDEMLVCIGDNICGYPCTCEPKECTEEECGPPPLCPAYECPDGSWAGCTGECERSEETGECGYVVRQCPDDPTVCEYPECSKGETLICIGDNICGYPCSCEPDDASDVDR